MSDNGNKLSRRNFLRTVGNVGVTSILGAAIVSCERSNKFSDINTPAQSAGSSTPKHPWTNKPFNNNAANFQFAIIPDRTGRVRPGIFESAIGKINLLQPEFAITVGDLIEGYEKNADGVESEWNFIESQIARLDMKFYYLAGNHDINNDLTRKAWIKRFGVTYYHFIYKDVLFLCLDGSVQILDEHIDHFSKVLKNNHDVRWTFVFIHKPRWARADSSDWQKFEPLLAGRNYTVFAGHIHEYSKTVRSGMNYYTLATAGGGVPGGNLAGPEHGQFDHITWVTMTDKEPIVANLALDGIFSDDPQKDLIKNTK